MPTADQVVVELVAKTDKYVADIGKAEASFVAKMQAMSQSAVQAGTAIAIPLQKGGAAADKAATSVQKLGNVSKVAAGQTGNLAAQFNDIAVTLASGQSPFTIALQQGTQISQVLNSLGTGGGVKATLGAIAGGFAQMINPISLVTIGVIALGGAAIQWLSSLGGELPKVNDILKEHDRLVKELGPAYEAALKGQDDYVAGSREFAKAMLAANAAIAQATILRAAQGTIGARGGLASGGGTSGLTQILSSGAAIEPARKAIQDFIDSVDAGKPKVQDFQNAIGDLVSTGAITQDTFNKITGVMKELIDVQSQLGASAQNLTTAQAAYAELQTAIAAIDSKEARDQLETLAEKAVDTGLKSKDIQLALEDLSRSNPSMQGPIMALQALIEKAQETAGVIANINRAGMGGRVGGTPGLNENEFNNRFGDDDSQRNKLIEQGDKIRAQEEQARKAAEAAQKRADAAAKRDARAAAKEDPLERFQRSTEERTRVAQAELDVQSQLNPLIEDYGLKMETARIYQEGLNAAQKAGVEITPDIQAGLMKQAEGLATVRAEQERLSAEQDKTRQNFEAWNNTAKDAVGGLISDLTSGKSAAEAFANALGKIADQLIQVGLNAIFDPQSGVFGGGGGGSLLGALFGGFKASGGPVNSNKAYMVGEQGPELFVPERGGTIIPNAPRLSGGSSGGAPAGSDGHVSVSIDDDMKLHAVFTRNTDKAIKRSQEGEAARLPGNLKNTSRRGLLT